MQVALASLLSPRFHYVIARRLINGEEPNLSKWDIVKQVIVMDEQAQSILKPCYGLAYDLAEISVLGLPP
jgi:hypothetical protein